MATVTESLSRNAIYRIQEAALLELQVAQKRLSELPAGAEFRFTSRTALELGDLVRVDLTIPDLLEQLWGSMLARFTAGETDDLPRSGEVLQRIFTHWCDLLGAHQALVTDSVRAGFAIAGAAELQNAADRLQDLWQRVVREWPAPDAPPAPLLPYARLRQLADRSPPPPDWYEEDAEVF